MPRMMLSPHELDDLRKDILETLVDTCTILRGTGGSVDEYGHWVESSGTAATSLACRLDPANSVDTAGLVAGREANRTYFVLTLAWDAVIGNGDQVSVGGEVMDVLQLFDVHSDRAVTRAILGARAG